MSENKGQTEQQANEMASRVFLENIQAIRLIAFCAAPARHLTDDIVNDTFILFLEDAERWDYSHDPLPLIKSILRNVALRYWKEYKRNLPESLAELAGRMQKKGELEVTDVSQIRSLELKALELCMETVSDENRKILEAHYVHGISIVELAKILKRNVNSLYSFFTRLRIAIRTCVEKKLREGVLDA